MKNFEKTDHPNFSVVFDLKLANKLLTSGYKVDHLDFNYKENGWVCYFPWSEEIEEFITKYYRLVTEIKNM